MKPLAPEPPRDWQRRKQWYHEVYLKSAHWKRMKRLVAERSGGTCERCTKARATEVHHTTYQRLGFEHMDDLQHVCPQCHGRWHSKGKKGKQVGSRKFCAQRSRKVLRCQVRDLELENRELRERVAALEGELNGATEDWQAFREAVA